MSTPNTLIKLGAYGAPVVTLQRALAAHGYPLNADGVFGPKTFEAVIKFQTAHNLKADGVVGFHTLAALTSAGPAGSAGAAAPSTAAVYGIDVSHYQTAVDWKMAAAMEKKFSIAKATDGVSSIRDSMFTAHRDGARGVGIISGAYHFFRFDDSPVQQAKDFMAATNGVRNRELPPTLDVEWDNKSADKGYHTPNGTLDSAGESAALKCLEAIEALCGVVPMVYTNYYFFTGRPGFTPSVQWAHYPLWISAYNTHTVANQLIPAPWSKCTLWQYSETLKLGGVDAIDGDIFNGSYEDLLALSTR